MFSFRDIGDFRYLIITKSDDFLVQFWFRSYWPLHELKFVNQMNHGLKITKIRFRACSHRRIFLNFCRDVDFIIIYRILSKKLGVCELIFEIWLQRKKIPSKMVQKWFKNGSKMVQKWFKNHKVNFEHFPPQTDFQARDMVHSLVESPTGTSRIYLLIRRAPQQAV